MLQLYLYNKSHLPYNQMPGICVVLKQDSFLAQEVLQRLERPLLSTSVHVEAEGELEFAEGAVMMDMFAGRGLNFVVDCGMRVRQLSLRSRLGPR